MQDQIDTQLLPYYLNRLVGLMNKEWLKTLRQHGLTVQRWQMMSILNSAESFRIADLTNMTGLEQPVLTRVIDQMVRDDLCARAVNPDDSRSRLVCITDQGRKLFFDLLPDAESFLSQLFGDIPETDKRQLVKTLSTLMANLE